MGSANDRDRAKVVRAFLNGLKQDPSCSPRSTEMAVAAALAFSLGKLTTDSWPTPFLHGSEQHFRSPAHRRGCSAHSFRAHVDIISGGLSRREQFSHTV